MTKRIVPISTQAIAKAIVEASDPVHVDSLPSEKRKGTVLDFQRSDFAADAHVLCLEPKASRRNFNGETLLMDTHLPLRGCCIRPGRESSFLLIASKDMLTELVDAAKAISSSRLMGRAG